ncbi:MULTISPECIES: hypothetical protein [unclassified Candidatus Frackibacter]|uniref:hypothetical protein n=1 Tax=unclassified Candidatus Frackibacter TaxID=2648818 RepID=UPI0008BA9A4D|nr:MULTISPECIES: hypothetical protein [unclassified Candidatus Frackibacter]SEM48477.1 CopG family transcriptional regulator / antitoxin EndoAI [Candidatus Frackibacter sp. WG12]SFL50325.1 CopG family transcriptional regulator / antitoxin EndoAI [Candidatus Frackibacter sp. WG13]
MANQQFLSKKEVNNADEECKGSLKLKMKKGYFKMGKINLKLAEEGLKADKEAYERV